MNLRYKIFYGIKFYFPRVKLKRTKSSSVFEVRLNFPTCLNLILLARLNFNIAYELNSFRSRVYLISNYIIFIYTMRKKISVFLEDYVVAISLRKSRDIFKLRCSAYALVIKGMLLIENCKYHKIIYNLNFTLRRCVLLKMIHGFNVYFHTRHTVIGKIYSCKNRKFFYTVLMFLARHKLVYFSIY